MKDCCEHIDELITANISNGSYEEGCLLINNVICYHCDKVYDITLTLDSVEEEVIE